MRDFILRTAAPNAPACASFQAAQDAAAITRREAKVTPTPASREALSGNKKTSRN